MILASRIPGCCPLLVVLQGPVSRPTRRLVDELPAGSWLAIAHPASDVARDKVATMTDRYNQRVTTSATLRTHAEISAFFAGTELLPPGVVQYHQWHPGEPARDAEGEVAAYCGLGRKR